LHDEAEKQVADGAQEIVRANVEKAKAGSLLHTKWLCSLIRRGDGEEALQAGAADKSLTEMLLQALQSKE